MSKSNLLSFLFAIVLLAACTNTSTTVSVIAGHSTDTTAVVPTETPVTDHTDTPVILLITVTPTDQTEAYVVFNSSVNVRSDPGSDRLRLAAKQMGIRRQRSGKHSRVIG